jgi:cellobiose phosphorylase
VQPSGVGHGGPAVFVNEMLGLRVDDGQLRIDPVIPEDIGRISIQGMRAFGTRWDVEAEGTTGEVRPAD